MPLLGLYRDIILDHFKNPRNFGALANGGARVRHENPSCGDELEVHVVVNDEARLADIKFYGRGCAISQSSASLMTVAVKGKSIVETRHLIHRFMQMFTVESSPPPEADLGDLKALEGVKEFPNRVPCATLAWQALEACLKLHAKDF